MSQLNSSIIQTKTPNKKSYIFAAIFLLIAIAGLFYVKWWPYFHKAILASTAHSIGPSILGEGNTMPSPSWESAWSYAETYFMAVWKAALLGVVLGSLIQVLIPSNWLLKVLGKTSFGSTAAGGLASLPGMMCTCCAAPIAIGMRKKNVSVGASLAFWLGNPTLNPATLIFMAFVLSWKFTLLRIVFGIILTFGVSYFANRFVKNVESVDMEKLLESAEQTDKNSFISRWLKSMGTMLLYVVPAYLLSVLLLGAGRVWLFPNMSDAAANSLLTIILFAIAGMLFVIPTAAEIPIIQTFMSFGLGAGPAAALLITLPAISLPSLLMVAKSYPLKVLLFITSSVVILGIISGLAGMLIL